MLTGLATAQSSNPLAGEPWDFGIWAGGGLSVPGGTKDTQAFNFGLRFGKVLTGINGSGWLRGNFEWSADLMPVYYIWQPDIKAGGRVVLPGKNAFGWGVNPLNLQWNFGSHNFRPYAELGGGTLSTSVDVPATTSTFNFVTHGGIGVRLFRSAKNALNMSVRYEHISNAGLTRPNPGINTVQFGIGYNRLK